MKKLLIAIAILLGGYHLYNADALYGQYLFSQMCKNEGGARFYKRVEKGQGWLEDVVLTAYGMKHLELSRDVNRGFVRFSDESGKQYDARLKLPLPSATTWDVINSPEYTLIVPANLAIPVRYVKRSIHTDFNPDSRFLKKQTFYRDQRQIIDIQSNEVVATYTTFGYQWTTPDRVILNAPTAVTCPIGTEDYEKYISDIYEKGEPK